MAKKSTSFFIRGLVTDAKTNRPYKWDDGAERSVPHEDGEYSIKIVPSEEDAKSFTKKIEAWAKDEGKKPKKWPFAPEVDRESGDETGRTVFTAKQYGKDQDGRKRTIPHVDAGATPLAADFFLTRGSTVVIKVHPTFYKAQGGGVKLYLDAIQVLDYKPYERDLGFAAQEGFRASGDADDEDEESSADDETENNEDTDF